ncbi:MAG: zf-HC2 domain-containing protein [Sphaerochaetaceae bacterium]|jgi:hypothetical protein|nr:zf-HC2 domain-containing protein [Sphaerochaetaceae bacterium]MDD3162748.1 zf-HC2 domain-containing protein [Sphaerochaetaceae bacterium]MDD4006968.1 zf-HC2 domain-containing protein [Sphaerochaetaceae bacterium]MDD4396067.1 zf-HC2 domain-containing protein [Sphaerochaetaceae bacterium]
MCLDDQILNTYLDGELAEPFKSQVEEHLGYCNACRERYQKLQNLKKTIDDAVLSDEDIASRQENVMKMIENTCFKRKKIPFFKRQLRINLPAFATVAAAFVFVFVGSIVYINKESNAFIPANVDNPIDESNVNLVNEKSQKTIDDYSLEEIINSLDKRGYTVDLKLKSVEPVKFEE